VFNNQQRKEKIDNATKCNKKMNYAKKNQNKTKIKSQNIFGKMNQNNNKQRHKKE